VAQPARAHPRAARALQGAVGAREKLLLLHAIHPGMVLRQLERVNFNVLDACFARGLAGVNPLAFQWKVLWSAVRGKITLNL